eukprot:3462798-Prymnesium_polylepis.1
MDASEQIGSNASRTVSTETPPAAGHLALTRQQPHDVAGTRLRQHDTIVVLGSQDTAEYHGVVCKYFGPHTDATVSGSTGQNVAGRWSAWYGPRPWSVACSSTTSGSGWPSSSPRLARCTRPSLFSSVCHQAQNAPHRQSCQ